MKNLIILLLLLTNMAGAQDTLFFSNGEKLNVRVVEIDKSNIKYKKSENLEGPFYTISKNEVEKIHYKNGTKDFFAENEKNTNKSVQKKNNEKCDDDVYCNDHHCSKKHKRRSHWHVGPEVIIPAVAFDLWWHRGPFRPLFWWLVIAAAAH